MNYQTYTTKIDLSKGCYAGRDNGIPAASQPAGFVPGLPDRLWAADSFEWVIHHYEVGSTKLDLSSGDAKIYIQPDVAGAARTQIGTGAIGSGDDTNVVTYEVPAGAIPSECYGIRCLVIAEVTGSAKQTTVVQYVEVSHYLPGGTGGVAETADLVVAPSGTVVEHRIYYLASGAWALADPDIPACETAELFIALGTSAAVDGMASQRVVEDASWSWGAANVGRPLYLADDGHMTLTVPTSPTWDGRVGRIVGWVRGDTSIRFDGHVPGATFEVTGT